MSKLAWMLNGTISVNSLIGTRREILLLKGVPHLSSAIRPPNDGRLRTWPLPHCAPSVTGAQ